MDSIEPYDYSGLKEFSTAYLPGFLADKYDVSVRQPEACGYALCQHIGGCSSGNGNRI